MNIPVLIVAILTAVAVVAHVIGGTRETAAIAPPKENARLSANWVQAMCAFQMLAVDLLMVTGLLFTIALGDVLPFEKEITLGLAWLYLAWGSVWVIQVIALKKQGITLLRLPHWVIWYVCAALLFTGA